MKYAVVGLGEFGKALTQKLAQRGAEVIAIDNQMDPVDDVKNDVALAVRMDATDEQDLRSQGVDKVDVLVAALGENVEANELVVVLAKRMGIPKVVARATNSIRARILKLIGADEVILPEEEAAARLSERLLYPSLKNYFELIEGYNIAEIEIPQSFVGKTLAELNLPKRHRVNLIVIKRTKPETMGADDPERILTLVPQGSDRLESGDVIAIAGTDRDIARLLEEMQ